MPIPDDLPPWAVGNYPAASGTNSWDATARRVTTGLTGFAANGLIPNAKTDAQSLNEWLGRLQEWIAYFFDEQALGVLGDGNDGSATDSANRTLARVHYYTDWTIDSNAVITTAGYPVFCTGTLTIDGASSALQWNGNAGADGSAGGAAGAAHTATVLTGGSAGGAGGASTVAGSAGSESGRAATSGTGGAGGTGNGGVTAAGAAGSGVLATGDVRSLSVALRGHVLSSIASGSPGDSGPITGGAGGGGGGGGNGGPTGGGGGSGGGVLIVCANRIELLNGATISAIGGAGGDGESGGTGGAGGGGGGMGGTIYLVARSFDLTGGTVSVAGGAGGALGSGPPDGTAGSSGAAGTIVQLMI